MGLEAEIEVEPSAHPAPSTTSVLATPSVSSMRSALDLGRSDALCFVQALIEFCF